MTPGLAAYLGLAAGLTLGAGASWYGATRLAERESAASLAQVRREVAELRAKVEALSTAKQVIVQTDQVDVYLAPNLGTRPKVARGR